MEGFGIKTTTETTTITTKTSQQHNQQISAINDLIGTKLEIITITTETTTITTKTTTHSITKNIKNNNRSQLLMN